MKVGQHHLDRAETIAGGNEQIGLAGEFRKRAVFGRRAFQKPQRSRTDRYDAPARATRRIERGRRFSADGAPFSLHAMTRSIVRLDWQKGAGTDVKRHPVNRDTGRVQFLNERLQ